MKFAGKWLSNLILCAALAGITACTVIPKSFKAPEASYDGNDQNSGFLGKLPDESAVITAHARERFNGLALVYGGRFIPGISHDTGLTPYTNGTWRITAGSMTKFMDMNRWRKQSLSMP